jgi:hypothetical protein
VSVDWSTEEWRTAPIIISDNATKDAFNIKSARAFAERTGRPLHWYHASDTIGRNKPVTNPELINRLQGMDSGATNSRLGKIPLVMGMPVMISQNFDVPGGVVNGCSGFLRSVRYRVDNNGDRHAISCVVEAPDTSPGIVAGLPDHHVVALEDTVPISFKDRYTKESVTVSRTRLPLLPAFAMTAHKAQGKTLKHVIINLQSCSGTETPYVMISRVTSLDGLLILKGFSISKITCRQSQESRDEARRQQYLALLTTIRTGTPEEVSDADAEIKRYFSASGLPEIPEDNEDETVNKEDPHVRLGRKERVNALKTRQNAAQPPVFGSPSQTVRPVLRVPRKGTNGREPTIGMFTTFHWPSPNHFWFI